MPNFPLFLATSIAITLAPGPDNLQVLARGISQGRAAGLVAALGLAAGITFHTPFAALGVSRRPKLPLLPPPSFRLMSLNSPG